MSGSVDECSILAKNMELDAVEGDLLAWEESINC